MGKRELGVRCFCFRQILTTHTHDRMDDDELKWYLERALWGYPKLAGAILNSALLKRNRTLKVLNLSENKIDVQGLVAIAESLVSSLNTINLERKTNC